MRLRGRFSLFFVAFSLGACAAAVADPVCTLIGCFSGLLVSFSTTPAGPVNVEVTSPSDTTPRVYNCALGTLCVPGPLLGKYMPDTAYVRVTYAGRTTMTEVHPVYEPQYPNGRSCGAACTSATITLPLP